MKNLHNTNEIT